MHRIPRSCLGGLVPQVMTADDLDRAIRRISHEIVERHHGTEGIVLVGIHSRGVPLAEQIAGAIESFEAVKVPVGELDIGLYRDDLASRPTTRLGRTLIPVDLSGETVVLVDDVLYTGRTIRSALDAVLDLGRPKRVELAVMCDRGHRELPIRPDYVGKNLPTSEDQKVKVRIKGIDEEAGVWISDGDGSDA